jgi:hypothetical protein
VSRCGYSTEFHAHQVELARCIVDLIHSHRKGSETVFKVFVAMSTIRPVFISLNQSHKDRKMSRLKGRMLGYGGITD